MSHLNGEQQLKMALLNDPGFTRKTLATPVRFVPVSRADASQDDGIDYDQTDDNSDHGSYTDVHEDDSRLRNGRVFRRLVKFEYLWLNYFGL